MAIDPNVPAIANAITGAVDNWNGFITDQRNWSAGTANGGPLNDGYYPLRNSLGISLTLPSPAKLVAMTTGPMAQAVTILSDVNASKAVVLSTANTVAMNLTYTVSNATAAAGSAATASAASTNANAVLVQVTTANTAVQASKTAAATSATQAAGSSTAANATLVAVNLANTSVQQAKTDAANSAASAEASASSVNPSVIYGAIASNVATVNGSITSNVATINGTLATKADLTQVDTRINANVATLNAAISGKANAVHTHVIADVTSLQTTLDGKLGVSPGITTGYAAFSVNSFGVDSYLGDGQLNLMGGAVHARTANATGVGHIYTTTARGASRVGLHDNAINLYVSNTANGTAGQPVSWQQTANITNAVANFLVQPQFNGVNLATSTDLSTGLAGKANLSGAAFTGAVTIGGATPWTSANLVAPSTSATASTLVQRDGSGNLYGNYIGTTSGLYHTAGMYLQPDTGANPVRWTVRSGNDTATGLNLSTNGTFRGALYADNGGNIGLLNINNAWRFQTTSGGAAYINADAGSSYTFWTSGNFDPNAKANLSGATFTGGVVMNSTLTVGTNVRASATGGTGQFTAVSGSTMAGFYNDGSQFYILKHATSNTAFDGHRPFYVNLSTGQVTIDGTGASTTAIGGGLQVAQAFRSLQTVDATTQAATGMGVRVRARSDNATSIIQFTDTGATAQWSSLYSNAAGSLRASTMFGVDGEFYANSWMRSATSGTGWYHEVHGGGWMMQDSTYVRCYGDKTIYTGGGVLSAWMQAGTVTATSDARFKTRIRDLEPVAGLVPKRFVKDGKERLGYIAQDVQATTAKEAVHDQFGVNGEHSLSLEPLAMLAAVHAQLEARIAALEARP